MPKAKPATPKKNQVVTNPYEIGGFTVKSPGIPFAPNQQNVNKVETVATAVPRIFVSYFIRPEGNGAAFIRPIKDYFSSHGDPELMADWKVNGFKTRRAYNPEDPKENNRLQGMTDKEVGWFWGEICNCQWVV